MSSARCLSKETDEIENDAYEEGPAVLTRSVTAGREEYTTLHCFCEISVSRMKSHSKDQ